MQTTLKFGCGKMADFEIGLVYQKNSRFFIAVDTSTLVSCKGGVATTVRPYSNAYSSVRSISVEELCEKWEINLDQFDVLMSVYIKPPQDGVKARPRGTRRKKGDDDEYWRRHRTGRITRPTL